MVDQGLLRGDRLRQFDRPGAVPRRVLGAGGEQAREEVPRRDVGGEALQRFVERPARLRVACGLEQHESQVEARLQIVRCQGDQCL